MFNLCNLCTTSGLLGGLLGLLADDVRHLQLLVLAHLGGLRPAQLKVLGDLLGDGGLLADCLRLLLALHVVVAVGVGLGRPPMVEIGQSWNIMSE